MVKAQRPLWKLVVPRPMQWVSRVLAPSSVCGGTAPCTQRWVLRKENEKRKTWVLTHWPHQSLQLVTPEPTVHRACSQCTMCACSSPSTCWSSHPHPTHVRIQHHAHPTHTALTRPSRPTHVLDQHHHLLVLPIQGQHLERRSQVVDVREASVLDGRRNRRQLQQSHCNRQNHALTSNAPIPCTCFI